MYILQLFSNGMKESEQRHVTLRINVSGININMHIHIHTHYFIIYIYHSFFVQ